jgi:hypothetical protein
MDPFPALFHHIIHARPMTRRFQLPKFLSAAFSPFLGGIHFRPSPLSIRTFLYRTPSHYFINGSFSPLANSSLTSPLSIRTFLYRTSPSHYFINGSFSSLANSSTALLPLRQFTELINRSPHFFPGLSILPTKLSLYL